MVLAREAPKAGVTKKKTNKETNEPSTITFYQSDPWYHRGLRQTIYNNWANVRPTHSGRLTCALESPVCVCVCVWPIFGAGTSSRADWKHGLHSTTCYWWLVCALIQLLENYSAKHLHDRWMCPTIRLTTRRTDRIGIDKVVEVLVCFNWSPYRWNAFRWYTEYAKKYVPTIERRPAMHCRCAVSIFSYEFHYFWNISFFLLVSAVNIECSNFDLTWL